MQTSFPVSAMTWWSMLIGLSPRVLVDAEVRFMVVVWNRPLYMARAPPWLKSPYEWFGRRHNNMQLSCEYDK